MTRRRTFEFEGQIVSVVPARQLRQVRSRQEAARITASAEREGGTDLLFDLLAQWAPLHPVRRDELRRLVVKEILEHSMLLQRPLREALAYSLPEPVDLRDLIEPTPLGADTTEPPSPEVVESGAWIEVEVVDTHGRPVRHFRGSLQCAQDHRTLDTKDGPTRHSRLPTSAPVHVTLEADPNG